MWRAVGQGFVGAWGLFPNVWKMLVSCVNGTVD